MTAKPYVDGKLHTSKVFTDRRRLYRQTGRQADKQTGRRTGGQTDGEILNNYDSERSIWG